MGWITTRDDENENNNEPFFIPIARTFTVDDDREEDREDLEETFFEMIDGDDRTALKEEANMMIDVASFLWCWGKTFVCWSLSFVCLCGLFFMHFLTVSSEKKRFWLKKSSPFIVHTLFKLSFKILLFVVSCWFW